MEPEISDGEYAPMSEITEPKTDYIPESCDEYSAECLDHWSEEFKEAGEILIYYHRGDRYLCVPCAAEWDADEADAALRPPQEEPEDHCPSCLGDHEDTEVCTYIVRKDTIDTWVSWMPYDHHHSITITYLEMTAKEIGGVIKGGAWIRKDTYRIPEQHRDFIWVDI